MTSGGLKREWRQHLRSPLVIGLLLSILLHLYCWWMVVLINTALANGWVPPWLKPVVQPIAAIFQPAKPTPTAPTPPAEPWEEIPLQFVEVDPLAVSPEAPPDTRFYSTANTLAANPDPPKVTRPLPKIDGRRENTLKTFDTTQPSPTPPPPAPKEVIKPAPAPEPVAAAKPEKEDTQETPPAAPPKPVVAQKPKPELKPELKPEPKPRPKRETPPVPVVQEPLIPPPGETLLAKADPKAVQPEFRDPVEPQAVQPQPPAPEAAKPRRPRTLAEARANKGAIVGERTLQEGGTERTALQSSLNVKASPLGDYNYRMVLAVQDRWYRLLEERRYALERQGQVVITFDLHADGTITAVTTKDSNVGEVLSFLCELAVMQPAPFGKWPTEIRRQIGGDIIPVTFTFNYY